MDYFPSFKTWQTTSIQTDYLEFTDLIQIYTPISPVQANLTIYHFSLYLYLLYIQTLFTIKLQYPLSAPSKSYNLVLQTHTNTPTSHFQNLTSPEIPSPRALPTKKTSEPAAPLSASQDSLSPAFQTTKSSKSKNNPSSQNWNSFSTKEISKKTRKTKHRQT